MTFRFPAPLAQAIEAQARAMGKDRTTVVAEALAQAFGLSLPSKTPITIEMLQQQVQQSEHSITLLSEQLARLQQVTRTDSNTLQRLELLEQFSHALRVLLPATFWEAKTSAIGEAKTSTIGEAKTDATLQPLATTRYGQEPSTLQQAEPNALQPTAQLQPQIDLPERILAIISDPVFVCDRLQRLVYVNPLGVRSLKLEQTATQATLQDLGLPPELKEQLTTQVETVFATGRSITSEINLITPLYGLRDYEYTLSPLQGTIDHIKAILFSTRDITERKQVEAALKATEANYQHLFESTNGSILILDTSTQRILNANTNAFKRLGYTRQELLKLDVGTIVPQWSSDAIAELTQRLQRHGKSIVHHCLCHKDGTKIPVEISSRLMDYGDRLAIQSFMHELSASKHSGGDRDQSAISIP